MQAILGHGGRRGRGDHARLRAAAAHCDACRRPRGRLQPVELVSRLLPLTNGLLAIRGVFDGAPVGEIVGHTALEAAVALGWMTAALLSFNRLASRGRRDGSLDYGA